MRRSSAEEVRRLARLQQRADAHSQQAQSALERRALEALARGAPDGAHPQALRRCLTNLIENALRYGGPADVSIEDDDAMLRIAVRDQGPGIPEDQLERVFEPFFRLEVSRSRDSGGVGLGLSIARNIARWHGGDVTLANAPEGGLTATLTLPRGAAAERPAADS